MGRRKDVLKAFRIASKFHMPDVNKPLADASKAIDLLMSSYRGKVTVARLRMPLARRRRPPGVCRSFPGRIKSHAEVIENTTRNNTSKIEILKVRINDASREIEGILDRLKHAKGALDLNGLAADILAIQSEYKVNAGTDGIYVIFPEITIVSEERSVCIGSVTLLIKYAIFSEGKQRLIRVLGNDETDCRPENYIHPHVFANGIICFGEGDVRSAIKKNNLLGIVDAVKNLLESCNEEDCVESFNSWFSPVCKDCGSAANNMCDACGKPCCCVNTCNHCMCQSCIDCSKGFSFDLDLCCDCHSLCDTCREDFSNRDLEDGECSDCIEERENDEREEQERIEEEREEQERIEKEERESESGTAD